MNTEFKFAFDRQPRTGARSRISRAMAVGFACGLALVLALAAIPARSGPSRGSGEPKKPAPSQPGKTPASALNAQAPVAGTAEEATRNVSASPSSAPVLLNAPQKVSQGGVTVEFSANPVGKSKKRPEQLTEGDYVNLRFRLTEVTGAALAGSGPAAWMDLRPGARMKNEACEDKVRSFLQPSLNARPAVDLNTWFVLALNNEPTISVLDPLIDFGGSRLLTMIYLQSTGEDWVMSSDQSRLFVTMPAVGQVAVAGTKDWEVIRNLGVGLRPTRLAFQHDQHYLWVATEGDARTDAGSGVTVLDPAALNVVARIPTGAGAHELAFSEDDHFVFVTNRKDGTLTIIDVLKLAPVKTVPTGPLPVAVAYSSLSKSAYVVNEEDGTVAVVGGPTQELITRVQARPGLRDFRFAPGGRWGVLLNQKEGTIQIIDASRNLIVQHGKIGKEPDRVSFSDAYAYIRSLRSDEIHLIALSQLGTSETLALTTFPGGQKLPGDSPSPPSPADVIVPSPEGDTVLIANPTDEAIYYYHEGMIAPSGSFQNDHRAPRAVLVVDKSLRESAPGVYSATVQMEQSGTYDVAFFLDTPKVVHCFDLTVKPNPALKDRHRVAFQVQALLSKPQLRVGENYRLEFKVTDPETHQPLTGLTDMGVFAMLAPGIWQYRQWARPLGDGLYEVNFVPPRPGAYYIFWECPSLKVRWNQLPYITLRTASDTPTASAGSPETISRRKKP